MWWILKWINVLFFVCFIKDLIRYLYVIIRCKIVHYCSVIKRKKCHHAPVSPPTGGYGSQDPATIATFERIEHPTVQGSTIKFNFLYPVVNDAKNLMISEEQPQFRFSKHDKQQTFATDEFKNRLMTVQQAPVSNPVPIDLTLAIDTKGNTLLSKLPPVYDQGMYGSCTANATALTWCILKLTGSARYTNGVYNTVFNSLTKLPSVASIYYNARSISGLLVQTTTSNNSVVSNRTYIDEGADPSLFANVFTAGTSADNTRITGGSYYALTNNKYVRYYTFGGQVYTGICDNSKWSYPFHATSYYSQYIDPYFLLYNASANNGQYDDVNVTLSNAAQKIQQIKNAVLSKLGLYSMLSSPLYNMSLSRMTMIPTPSSNIQQLSQSTFYKTLQSGLPIMLGYVVYSSFMNTTSNGIVPSISGSVLGGHCVVIVGIITINNVYYVKCRNSWSSSWGNAGYFFMPFAVFTDRRTDASLYVFSSAN